MRKVFVSNLLMAPLEKVKFVSNDFQFPQEKEYSYAFTYIVDLNVEEGDTVALITCLTDIEDEKRRTTQEKNYQVFKEEIGNLLKERNAKAEFIEIYYKNVSQEEDSMTLNRFFKRLVKLVKSGDRLFLDVTFGFKSYTITTFLALTYAARIIKNVAFELAVYSERFDGSDGEKKVTTTYNLTSLFYLSEIASKISGISQGSADKLLDFIIPDKE